MKALPYHALTSLYISFIYLIAPLKLGSVINSAGVGFYPLTILEWIVAPWPTLLTPTLTSIALLLALLSDGKTGIKTWKNNKHFVLPIVSLFIVSIIGAFHTSEYDYAQLFIWHVLAAANFLIAVFLHLQCKPESRKWFIIAICAGTLLSVASGLYQVKYGFEETRLMAMSLAEEEGRTRHPLMIDRLNQTRAYASFTYPNSYAAHLILTVPLLVAFVWRASKRIEPPLLSQILFTGTVLLSSTATLMFSGSRGAVAAVALAGIAVAVLLLTQYKQWVCARRTQGYLLVTVAVIMCIALIFSVFKDRSLLSVGARFDYYKAALAMFFEHPLAGVGLGEFFPHYLRLKPLDAEETRLVHNLFLHFLSQCGIIGGLAASYFLLQPLILWTLTAKKKIASLDPILSYAALTGCLAWNIHALTDFNVQISGSFLTAASLPMLAFPFTNECRSGKYGNLRLTKTIPLILAIIGLGSILRAPGEKAYQKLYNRSTKGVDAFSLIEDTKLTASKLPHSPHPWDLLGKTALSQDKMDLAIDAFSEASKRAPHRASYYAFLAQCLARKGDLTAARENIDKALMWYPLRPEYISLQRLLQ